MYAPQTIGFGCHCVSSQYDSESPAIAVYIANKPNMVEYQQLTTLTALTQGEIKAIGLACGNGWRKVFNVYAKLLFALDRKVFNFQQQASNWQTYRDEFLLQPNSKTALIFSVPSLIRTANVYHIICGKTHAKALLNSGKLTAQLTWLDNEFAIDEKNKLVVCPYFDYRQLSNSKIERLAEIIGSMRAL